MKYRSPSSLSYRNVLIAAGLAVGLGVGSTSAEASAATAVQPQSDGRCPDSQSPTASVDRAAATAPQTRR